MSGQLNLCRTALSAALLCSLVAPLAALAALAEAQHFAIAGYRVGPYAAGGTGQVGGLVDYLELVNARDGGVNGVKLSWSECETEYKVERGVECYERLKKEATTFNPFSVGIACAVVERATADKIPVITQPWPHGLQQRSSLPLRVPGDSQSVE